MDNSFCICIYHSAVSKLGKKKNHCKVNTIAAKEFLPQYIHRKGVKLVLPLIDKKNKGVM